MVIRVLEALVKPGAEPQMSAALRDNVAGVAAVLGPSA